MQKPDVATQLKGREKETAAIVIRCPGIRGFVNLFIH
jgi:hypothetical protein